MLSVETILYFCQNLFDEILSEICFAICAVNAVFLRFIAQIGDDTGAVILASFLCS